MTTNTATTTATKKMPDAFLKYQETVAKVREDLKKSNVVFKEVTAVSKYVGAYNTEAKEAKAADVDKFIMDKYNDDKKKGVLQQKFTAIEQEIVKNKATKKAQKAADAAAAAQTPAANAPATPATAEAPKKARKPKAKPAEAQPAQVAAPVAQTPAPTPAPAVVEAPKAAPKKAKKAAPAK